MGGDFNNRLLFTNNRLLFSLLFSGNFCEGEQGLDEGRQSRDRGEAALGKTLNILVRQ